MGDKCLCGEWGVARCRTLRAQRRPPTNRWSGVLGAIQSVESEIEDSSVVSESGLETEYRPGESCGARARCRQTPTPYSSSPGSAQGPLPSAGQPLAPKPARVEAGSAWWVV